MTKKEDAAKPDTGVVRVAAVADLHCMKTSAGQLQPMLARMVESADLLLLGGDLTDFGLPEEAHIPG